VGLLEGVFHEALLVTFTAFDFLAAILAERLRYLL
jgi:hypothetical protein